MPILDYVVGHSTILTGDKDLGSLNNSTYLAPYAREGIIGNAENYPYTIVPIRTNPSSFWFSTYVRNISRYNHNTNNDFIYFLKNPVTGPTVFFSDIAFGLSIDDNSNSKIKINTCDGSSFTEVAVGTNVSFIDDITYRLDIEVILGSSGAIRIYVDKALEAEFVGNTLTNPGIATIGGIRLRRLFSYETYDTYFSSTFVADEDSREILMVERAIQGNGTFTDMQGSYTDIDEVGNFDDSNYLVSTSTGQQATFTTEDAPAELTSSHEVIGVGVWARVKANPNAATKNLGLIISDATNVVEQDTTSLTEVYSPKVSLFPNAPDGGAWDFTKLNALEVGVKV